MYIFIYIRKPLDTMTFNQLNATNVIVMIVTDFSLKEREIYIHHNDLVGKIVRLNQQH